MNISYYFYYIKDLLGNIRETYVHPVAGYKECIQRMQYYPSGLPWGEAMYPSEQPWKYNGRSSLRCMGWMSTTVRLVGTIQLFVAQPRWTPWRRSIIPHRLTHGAGIIL